MSATGVSAATAFPQETPDVAGIQRVTGFIRVRFLPVFSLPPVLTGIPSAPPTSFARESTARRRRRRPTRPVPCPVYIPNKDMASTYASATMPALTLLQESFLCLGYKPLYIMARPRIDSSRGGQMNVHTSGLPTIRCISATRSATIGPLWITSGRC
jgi:hypothetical protein